MSPSARPQRRVWLAYQTKKNEGTPFSQTNCYFSKFKLPGYGAGRISPPRTVRTANRGPLFFISFISTGKPECAFLLFLSPHSVSISVVSFRAAQEELIGQRPRGFFLVSGQEEEEGGKALHIRYEKGPFCLSKKELGTKHTYSWIGKQH